jgi:hypothetical protein
MTPSSRIPARYLPADTARSYLAAEVTSNDWMALGDIVDNAVES